MLRSLLDPELSLAVLLLVGACSQPVEEAELSESAALAGRGAAVSGGAAGARAAAADGGGAGTGAGRSGGSSLAAGAGRAASSAAGSPAGVGSPGNAANVGGNAGGAGAAVADAAANAAGASSGGAAGAGARSGGSSAAGAGADAAGASAAGASAAGASAAGSASAPAGDITIWLAGDSTVAKGNTPCPVGWGNAFQELFTAQATVVNSAVGGRSVRTWLYEVQTQMDSSGECALNKDSAGEPVLQMRWQAMLDGMKQGDYLFIQFGINDSSRTCDRHVGIEAFKESYGMMALAAKERGAQPVFVTPVSAIACEGSNARPTRGEFVTATIAAGESFDVPVIDLHERSIALYNDEGLCPIPGGSDVSASTGGKVGDFFCDDHTHFSGEGAAQIAKLMAEALKDQSLGLAAYLK